MTDRPFPPAVPDRVKNTAPFLPVGFLLKPCALGPLIAATFAIAEAPAAPLAESTSNEAQMHLRLGEHDL